MCPRTGVSACEVKSQSPAQITSIQTAVKSSIIYRRLHCQNTQFRRIRRWNGLKLFQSNRCCWPTTSQPSTNVDIQQKCPLFSVTSLFNPQDECVTSTTASRSFGIANLSVRSVTSIHGQNDAPDVSAPRGVFLLRHRLNIQQLSKNKRRRSEQQSARNKNLQSNNNHNNQPIVNFASGVRRRASADETAAETIASPWDGWFAVACCQTGVHPRGFLKSFSLELALKYYDSLLRVFEAF